MPYFPLKTTICDGAKGKVFGREGGELVVWTQRGKAE